MHVQRFDFGGLGKVQKTAGGGIRVSARLSRTGVQTYTYPDGRVTREYRDPDEVFAPEALESLRTAPVIEGHISEGVRPDNWNRVALGTVSDRDPEKEKLDGHDWVVSELVINSAAGIRKLDSKELQECSLGYTCVWDPTPGVTPEGERYDVRQTQIRVNHVGLGPAGFARAGRQARVLRQDGNQIIIEETNMSEPKSRPRVKFDGVDYEQGSDSHISAMSKGITDRDARIQGLEDKLAEVEESKGELKAKLDSLQTDFEQAKAQVSEAAIESAVKDRLAFEKQAAAILGDEFKFDGLSKREVQLKAVQKALPALEVQENVSDAELAGLYKGAAAAIKREDWAPIDKADSVDDSAQGPGVSKVRAAGLKAYEASLKEVS